MAIPTTNILHPSAIAGTQNLALVSGLQLLTPQYSKQYVQKYGDELFTWFLNGYGAMEQVKNREFFWFENRGKLMVAITTQDAIVAPAAGATVNIQLSVGDHYNAGTQTPLRVGETVVVASSNIEGEIIEITDTTANAFKFNVRPKQSTQAFVSGGSADLLAGEILIFGGDMDAGEASQSIEALNHLDQKYTNTYTEMRESWSETDLGGMTEIFYNSGVSGFDMPGGSPSGWSYFSYKELVMAEKRFANNVERKLMRGDVVTNTGLNGTNSVGTQGLIPKVLADGVTVTYTPGNLDIAKFHEIARVADVNGCAKQIMWLQDIYQNQDFSDGIFGEFPAGAFVWGKNEASEEAAVAYGTKNLYIDGYTLMAKKYNPFNTEYYAGKTPTVSDDYFANFGLLCPLGTSPKYPAKGEDNRTNIKNVTIMWSQPPAGGTIGNGIRVWQHGGGSRNPTSGTLTDNIEFATYRGLRVAAANQFIVLQKS